MSISAEYEKYRSVEGTLTEMEYGIALNNIKTKIGNLINFDPKNRSSDIGRRIFGYLDLSSAITFSQVSKGLYARSKNRWFVTQARKIVLKYVQQGISYKDYLKNGGWQDFIVVIAKVAGLAITITTIKSYLKSIKLAATPRT